MCCHCKLSPTVHGSSRKFSRSSSPPLVLTTALQTALTSAQRMTALSSWWRRAPRVPALGGANTEATTAAAAPAAPSRPGSKHQTGLSMVALQPTHHKGSLQAAHQRAAALRPLTLRQKLQNQMPKNQGLDAKSVHVCHRSLNANCCVFGSVHPLKCMFSTKKNVHCHYFLGTISGLFRRLYSDFAFSLLFTKHCGSGLHVVNSVLSWYLRYWSTSGLIVT